MPWWEVLREEPLDGFEQVDKEVYRQVIELNDEDSELYYYLVEVRAIECFGPFISATNTYKGIP